jgi:hypothetical protein
MVLKNDWKGGGNMKRTAYWLLALILVWGCGGKDPVDTALPAYLKLPTSLSGYTGSGLITIDGGLSLRAEGTEHLDATTETYSGVLGDISQDDLLATFTLGQPRIYNESSSVPAEYRANGELRFINAITPGTYRMGTKESPGPRGEIADLTLNLPGPQLYISQTGSLTITESTLVNSEGSDTLYRIKGSFQIILKGSGIGTTPGKEIPVSGSFDLLLLKSR